MLKKFRSSKASIFPHAPPFSSNLLPIIFYQLLFLPLAAEPHATFDEKHRVFFSENCNKCHNAEKQKGKVRLDDIPFTLDTIERADLWQKILNAINSGDMPPEDEKQPDPAAKTEFLDSLSQTLVAARSRLSDSGGTSAMRRLNRREYKNTIRDLLGVEIDASNLPADGGAGAFDTVGASLFMSSDQFEQYLALGRRALDDHFIKAAAPVTATPPIRIEPEIEANTFIDAWLKRNDEDAPKFKLWAEEVDRVAALPENQEILTKIKAFNPQVGNVPSQIYYHAPELKGAPEPAKYGLQMNGPTAAFQNGERLDYLAYVRHHSTLPQRQQGAFLMIAYGYMRIDIKPPTPLPPGKYTLRVRVGATQESAAERRFIEVGATDLKDDLKWEISDLWSSHQITGTLDNPQTIEIPIEIKPNEPQAISIRERQPRGLDVRNNFYFLERNKTGYGPAPAIWVDYVELEKTNQPTLAVPRIEPETQANPILDTWVSDYAKHDAKFKPWAAEIDRFATAPENAQVMAEIMAKDTNVKMPPAAENVMLYYYADQLKGAPRAQDHGFRDAHDAAFMNQHRRDNQALIHHYAALPPRQQGAYLMIGVGYNRIDIKPPNPLPPGKYKLRIRVGAPPESDPARRFLDVGPPDPKDEFNLDLSEVWNTGQVTGTIENPQTLEIPIEIKSTDSQVICIRERQPRGNAVRGHFHFTRRNHNGYGAEPSIWVDWVELEKKTGAVALPGSKIQKERREVEQYANTNVSYVLNHYFKAYFLKAKAFFDSDRSKPASSFGLVDEADAKFREQDFNEHAPTYERYLNDPLTQTGAYLTIGNPHKEELIALPPDKASGWDQTPPPVTVPQPGKYILRFRIGANPAVPQERRFVVLGSRKSGVGGNSEFNQIETFQVTANLQDPQIIEFPVDVTLDGPRTFVLRERRDFKNDHLLFEESRKLTGAGPIPALWVDWVEWEGPFQSALTEVENVVQLTNSRNLDEPTHAKECLSTLATRAFRGKAPGQEFLDKLFAIYQSRRTGGDAHDVALKETLSIILASPGFIYLQETGSLPADASKPAEKLLLSPTEFASRLSYFLWSSPPDATLLSLANSSELLKPEVLTREVDRMIASPKSDEFIDGFVHQWLHMARLDFFQFNNMQFRDFDESTKSAARREVYETFAYLLRGNGSLSKLLKSDEVHVNGLLATYYGIEGVSGEAFQKVKLPTNSPRGGLLGMAAILAMGSNGERTSPVERGAWVLRHLLHNPPPPAPPNVPQLSRLEGKPLHPRERLAAHMEEPQCSSCHRKIDPIGFGLENFDAVGKWRDKDYEWKTNSTWPIDPAGTIHNGPAFKDYYELRDYIASKNDDFAQGFTEGLIEYALGRPYGFTDADLAKNIIQQAKAKNFELKEFIAALVTSPSFGKK